MLRNLRVEYKEMQCMTLKTDTMMVISRKKKTIILKEQGHIIWIGGYVMALICNYVTT